MKNNKVHKCGLTMNPGARTGMISSNNTVSTQGLALFFRLYIQIMWTSNCPSKHLNTSRPVEPNNE